jgi:hypothetical protein
LRLVSQYLPREEGQQGEEGGWETYPKFTSENLKKRDHSDKIIQMLNIEYNFNIQ